MQENSQDNRKVNFEQVLEDELALLGRLRDGSSDSSGCSVYERAHAAHLAGLAFSGGGIRSATFNLGVIQALSRYGLLAKFDYLSTVSGGGYIGGWLSALLQRKAAIKKIVNQHAVEKFESSLKTHPDNAGLDGDIKTVGFYPVEHMAVRYLRRYSNYLSPRLGLSGDMLAAVSIFLRNFTLIQLILVSLVASILLLAHVVGAGSVIFSHNVPGLLIDLQKLVTSIGVSLPAWIQRFGDILSEFWPYVFGAIALVISVWRAGRLMAERKIRYERRVSASRAVNYGVILPATLAAWWFSATVVMRPMAILTESGLTRQAFVWMLIASICYASAWGLGFYSKWRMMQNTDRITANGRPAHSGTLGAAALFSGALLGLLLFAAACYIRKVSGTEPIDIWHAVGFGPPLFLMGLSFVVAIHMGAVRRAFSEDDREWLARLGGFVLLYSAAWALIFSLVLYATPLVNWLAGGGLVALGGWAVGSGLGAWFARGPSTSATPEGSGWKEIVTRIAPWLFLVGIGIIVAHGTQITLYELLNDEGYVQSPDADFFIAVANNLQQLRALPVAGTFYAFLGVVILFGIISWRFDINLFSLHALYCNRLARAYLGASRAGRRNPNPFTGFDDGDDMPFTELAEQRPIHIINTAINMTGGDDLAWQTRRASSFAFTPCWAGYEIRSSQGTILGKYRRTGQYAGGRPLGTLMAVSGAAASPNMGYHTSPAVAALMTAFNLRLGRWCGNPDPIGDSGVWRLKSPRFAAKPIFAELSGSANAQADWVNLTDGGHFENLGVYELIRRRCRLIVVTDAGCDPKHQFEDLANMVRKCWTDFGVNIRFEDLEPMHLQCNGRYSSSHGAVGYIQYHDSGPDGIIIYLKASMTGDEWPDIRQYADSHSDFPHETTADQFFDESQFEAYRHLGYKVIAKMVKTLQVFLGQEPKDTPIAEIVNRLHQAKADK